MLGAPHAATPADGCRLLITSKGEDMPSDRGRNGDAGEAASDSVKPDLHYCSVPTPSKWQLPTVANFHVYTASQADSFVSKVSS